MKKTLDTLVVGDIVKVSGKWRRVSEILPLKRAIRFGRVYIYFEKDEVFACTE